MTATDVQPNRLVAAKRAARAASWTRCPSRVNVGVLAFNQPPARAAEPDARPRGGARRDRRHGAQRRHRDRRRDRTRPRRRCERGRASRPSARPPRSCCSPTASPRSGRDAVAAARAAKRAEDPGLHGRARHRPRARSRCRAAAAAPRRGPSRPTPSRSREIARASGRQGLHRRHRRRASRRSTSGSAPSSATATRSARSPPPSPAAGSLLLLAGAAMSLRWFGRLDLTPRKENAVNPNTTTARRHREEPRAGARGGAHEMKRVIVGQDAMLERLIVALLAGGHVLLEGVPGLAKTLTVKTLAQVLGGTLPPDPVHARPRAGRPRRHAHLPARQRPLRRSSSGPCSATSCSPTRSTARPPRCSRRCSR